MQLYKAKTLIHLFCRIRGMKYPHKALTSCFTLTTDQGLQI